MLSLLPAVSAARTAASCAPPPQMLFPGFHSTPFDWPPPPPAGGALDPPSGNTAPHQPFAFHWCHKAAENACTAPPNPRNSWMTNPSTTSANDSSSPALKMSSAVAVAAENNGTGGSLFRPPPLGLPLPAEFSPPSPRLYPPPYSPASMPYLAASPTATPPSPSAPYFFPFPHPNPYSARHYLQMEPYSAVLAGLGGGIGHPGAPPRPTPIFSSPPSVPSQSMPSSLFPPPLLHSAAPAFAPPKSPAVPLFGSPSGLPSVSPPDVPPISPASTSSHLGSDPDVGSDTPPSPYRFVGGGKEGSLKHRFLTRPGPADEGGDGRATATGVQSLTAKSSRSPPSRGSPSPATGATKSTVLQPHYPAHFMKGSIIQLANGELKCVEDLRTEDFVRSAELSADLQIDSSTVVKIEDKPGLGTVTLGFSVGEQRIQVSVEATLEHPFFVFGQGWSSCFPERTQQRFALSCHQLQVGDVCISLTHRRRQSRSSESSSSILRPIPSVALLGPTAPVIPAQRRKRRWSASDALTLTATALPAEQRSSSLAEEGDAAQ